MLSENGADIKIDTTGRQTTTLSIQNGGQTLPSGFNFAPISRADILKCAFVEFI